MNWAPFSRLCWKQYRSLRGLWLGVLLLGLVLQVSLRALWTVPEGAATVWAVCLVLPSMFLVGAAAMFFALEREDGTDDWLRALAIPPGPLFLSQLVIVTVGSLLLFVVSMGSALGLARGGMAENDGHRLGVEVLPWLIGSAEAFLFVLFVSLGSKKVLGAAVGGVALWFAYVALLTFVGDWLHVDETGRLLGIRAALLAPMLILDYWLVARWLACPPSERSWASPSWSEGVFRLSKRPVAERDGPPLRELKRLCWQEWRRAYFIACAWPLGALLLMLGVKLWSVGGPGDDHHSGVVVGLYAAIAFALVAGVQSFHGEQEGLRFRFLAERGVAPGVVWLGKHLAWLPLVFLVGAILFGLGFIMDGLRAPPAFAWEYVGIAIFILVGYAAGQFASILFARAIMALVIGAMLCVLAGIWGAMMVTLDLPLAWSAGPIPLILMTASFARAPDWLLERFQWRGRFKLAAAFLVPGLSLLVAIAVYRVVQIPATAVPPLWLKSPSPQTADALSNSAADPPSAQASEHAPREPDDNVNAKTAPRRSRDEDRATALIFRDAMKHIGDSARVQAISDGYPRGAFSPAIVGWSAAADVERAWLASNVEALRLAREAAGRPGCLFHEGIPLPYPAVAESPRGVGRLVHLFLLSSRKLQSEGKFDESLADWAAALRLAGYWANNGGAAAWDAAAQMQSEVIRWLPHWLSTDLTEERIERAHAELRRAMLVMPSPFAAMLTEFQSARYALTNFSGAHYNWLLQQQGTAPLPWRHALLNGLGTVFFWEKYRALRLLDLVFVEDLARAQQLSRQLEDSLSGVDPFLLHLSRRADTFQRWARSTPIIESWWPMIGNWALVRTMRFRQMELAIDLYAYKRARGKFPEDLNDMARDGIGRAQPVDPYSGQAFGYAPRGFGQAISLEHGAQVIPPNRPLLWSVGANGIRFEVRAQAADLTPHVVITDRFGRVVEGKGNLGTWEKMPILVLP